MRNRTHKGRTLTEDEQRLWQHIAQQAHPISHRISDEGATTRSVPLVNVNPRPATYEARVPMQVSEAPLALASYAGIDRNTAQRFRSGELPLEGSIDLHGMTREKAHRALSQFIHLHYERGSRFVLAVTGKGLSTAGLSGAAGTGRGILRELLPQWLTEPGLRPMILAVDVAKPKHGGSGAYYVLLRRNRHGG